MRRRGEVIRAVDPRAEATGSRLLRRLLRLQREAYQREAALIGYEAIPALKDTPAVWRAGGESFHVLLHGPRPLGMLSWHRNGGVVEICRLVVRPRYWRRGVASRLLDHLERCVSAEAFEVSTAEANRPAVQLYQKRGFRVTSRCLADGGLPLVRLRKPGHGGGPP